MTKSMHTEESPTEKIAKKTHDDDSSSSSVSEHEKHVQKVLGGELLADLFHSQLGINPNGHIVLADRGFALYSQGQEERLEYAQAQLLLDKSVTNFNEGAAMALVQAGNAYMCAARTKEKIPAQLDTAYERVKNGYQMAERMYKQALKINPGLYVGLRSLGQQQFEMAKLKWFFALQQGIDLVGHDLEEVFELFDKAKEYMNDATKAPTLLEVAEQAKIKMFWGYLLFERSQVEYKYGLADWKSNLELAIKYLEDAGASEAEVAIVTNNHLCKTGESVSSANSKPEAKLPKLKMQNRYEGFKVEERTDDTTDQLTS